MTDFTDLLATRRSVLAKCMLAPGPTTKELRTILEAAHRVPDHGKIGPWRFVIFEGGARESFSVKLANIYQQENPEASEQQLQFHAQTLLRAPLVIAVISTAGEHIKVPEWEQVLSAGACCQNILLAASALGYGAQWLTEWYSYSPAVHSLLSMGTDHKVAGFIYIGSFEEIPSERVRPDLEERICYWTDQ